MPLRNYKEEDYETLCAFLIGLNQQNGMHINWNWARWEWMYEHPEFDKSLTESIGLWEDGGRIVGAAIYDMYFGEGFCGALPGYESLYPDILAYAYKELRDENGFGFAVCDDDEALIGTAEKAGFVKTEQSENILRMPLDHDYSSVLPEGYAFAELDPVKELYDFQWLLWQGFDHGDDRAEFERENDFPQIPYFRVHFNPFLSVAAVDRAGEKGSYCCLWYDEKTDYAYVEPVCAIPSARGKGITRAVIYEALGRAKALGAKNAFVISDMDFYRRLGFEQYKHFSFYHKP